LHQWNGPRVAVPARGRLRPLAASTVLRGRAAHHWHGAAGDQERPQSQLNALASGGHGGPWALSCSWQGSRPCRADSECAAARARLSRFEHPGRLQVGSKPAGGHESGPACYAQGGDLPESGTLPPASPSPICRNRGRSPRVTVSPIPIGGSAPSVAIWDCVIRWPRGSRAHRDREHRQAEAASEPCQ
jgi:hypothetical protein